MSTLYEDFIESLQIDKPLLMTHTQTSLRLASKLYEGYLTDDELQEKQLTGRFWDIMNEPDATPPLFVILDNDTVLCVHKDGNGKNVDAICHKEDIEYYFPEKLKGLHYLS